MKALMILAAFLYAVAGITTFDNSSYIEDARVVKMLDVQFVKDIDDSDLKTEMEDILSNFVDKVSHISGHYAKESDMHYYAIYGAKDGKQTFQLVEVGNKLFENNQYYKTGKVALGSCRRGNGYPLPPVCQGPCMTRKDSCLGIICIPDECIW